MKEMKTSEFLPPLRWLPMIILAALLVILAGGLAADEPGRPAMPMADLPIAPAESEVELPDSEQILVGTQPTISATPLLTPSVPASPIIHMSYFSRAGCQECTRANSYLDDVQSLYPQLTITEFPIEEAKVLSEWLGQRYGVPEEKRMSTPMVFVGEDYLVGSGVNVENLQAVLDKYVSGGAEATWKDFDPEQSGTSIVERFRSFGLLTVLGAGLIDGLNPCAFTTLIFFVSYLAIAGRKGKEILLVGAAFTGAVFLAYLLVGLGVLTFLHTLGVIKTLSRWVYQATAILCLVLAALSLYDFYRIQRGKPTDMILKLPQSLQKRVRETIRERRRIRGYVFAAFVTGLIVSMLELACTGQVYLPTIIFVMGMPELRANAFLYLILYNLFFTLPLVVVFLLAFYGTTSRQMAYFINQRMAAIKLATAGLFLTLAAWLLYALV